MTSHAEIPVTITSPLTETTVVEGETATFECETSKPDVEASWFKDDLELLPDDHYDMVVEGVKQALVIQEAGPEDEAEYTIEVGDDSSTALLHVQGVTPEIMRFKGYARVPEWRLWHLFSSPEKN